ncbi:hypothetical protein JZO70_06785 [Enterococcus sp. 669A]|uniref:Inner membrane protein n=1 Tax=Candidatus Enterococcus moelleringii TaxID=2815325 RepID=A0ABS3L8B0_9ENTE|nr:hypothetical protein [Enterococcus sp. 669A]MBO1305857.1 hypothetical protein [Enterococcus sp. 669A]
MKQDINHFARIVFLTLMIFLIIWRRGQFTIYSAAGLSLLLVFYMLSYVFERKWLVGRYWQLGIYCAYWFLAGTFCSLVLAGNPASLQMIVLYFGLSFIGSAIWCAVLPKLFRHRFPKKIR